MSYLGVDLEKSFYVSDLLSSIIDILLLPLSLVFLLLLLFVPAKLAVRVTVAFVLAIVVLLFLAVVALATLFLFRSSVLVASDSFVPPEALVVLLFRIEFLDTAVCTVLAAFKVRLAPGTG